MEARIAAATEIDLVGRYRIRFGIELPSRFQPVRSAVMIATMAPYIVAPSTHGANSAPPKSKLSLLVG
jgi:hypothetical protein